MRFVSLSVDSFQAVRRARLAFGSGLNVVFGPNDLGKSTLATAIQAALLVLPSSSEAATYSPWYVDATPRVELVFTDDEGRFWKVSKAFGGEQTAELHSSKDGRDFKLDCKQRAVEGKLRELLAWGIPAPGGKGAPRGLPISFLSPVLLAPQTDVAGILEKSLAADAANSGQLHLNKALATLAQDPLFKSVLDQAQGEVGKIFTPTGQIKKASELAAASAAIKKVQLEVAEAELALHSSRSVEDEVNRLRAEHGRALEQAAEAQTALEDVKRRQVAHRARTDAESRVAAAKADVDQLDAAAARIAAIADEQRQLEGQAKQREADLAKAVSHKEASGNALREAENQLRDAKSEDGARQRALEKARLEQRAAELRAELQALRAEQEKVQTARAAAAELKKAQDESSAVESEVAKWQRALATAEGSLPDLEREVSLARGIQAYGRWHVAALRTEEANKSAAQARDKRAAAEQTEQRIAQLVQSMETTQALVRSRGPLLPDAGELTRLVELDRRLGLADAKLGGGLSIAVRVRGQTVVKAGIDGRPLSELDSDTVLEAERSASLSIGKNVDLEVTAGSPEVRREVELLRKDWLARGAPALERVQAGSLNALVALAREDKEQRQQLVVMEKDLERLHTEAKAFTEQANQLEQQSLLAGADAEELIRLRAMFEPAQEQLLATSFAKVGRSWEKQVEALLSTAERKRQAATDVINEAKRSFDLAGYKAAEQAKRIVALGDRAKELVAALGGAGLEPVAAAVAKKMSALTGEEQSVAASLRTQELKASQAVSQAQERVDAASAVVEAATKNASAAEKLLEDARAVFHKRGGELAQAQEQLENANRPAREATLSVLQAELAALPALAAATDEDRIVTEAKVDNADRAVAQMRQALHTAEGALSQVGGAALADQAERLREALDAAKSRERELQIDAHAWRLLQETLREVENEEGAHLGRALAVPVSRRFEDLTAGRYGSVRIDTGLKTEAIDVSGANTADMDVVQALSVGTRDQLATLIRLTIAEQLKTTIVLDDQLVHTDTARMKWFVDAFLKTALQSQVIVLTCLPDGYLEPGDLKPGTEATWDVAGGRVRVIDAARLVERFADAREQRALGSL